MNKYLVSCCKNSDYPGRAPCVKGGVRVRACACDRWLAVNSLLTPPKEIEASSLSLSLFRSQSQNHCQKSCPHIFCLFLGSIVRFIIIYFHPLPTLHRVQQGDVNFSPDPQRSDTRAMDKTYSGVKNPWLTLVKHPHKRGATSRLVRPGLHDLPSSWSPGQSDVLALRGSSPTVT